MTVLFGSLLQRSAGAPRFSVRAFTVDPQAPAYPDSTEHGRGPMSSKYYAHFVADAVEAQQAGEYTGVVELTRPLRREAESKELRAVLARNFDLNSDDIRILHWARLH